MHVDVHRWLEAPVTEVVPALVSSPRLSAWLAGPLVAEATRPLGPGVAWQGWLPPAVGASVVRGRVRRRRRDALVLDGTTPDGDRVTLHLSASPWDGGTQVAVGLAVDRHDGRRRAVVDRLARARLRRGLERSLDRLAAAVPARGIGAADAAMPTSAARVAATGSESGTPTAWRGA